MKNKITLALLGFLFCFIQPRMANCELLNQPPTPQMGAMMSPQFVNLWHMVSGNDKHGQGFNEQSALSIGDDGWPTAGKKHQIRYYPGEILPHVQANNRLKFRYKGSKDQLISNFGEYCSYQNIQQQGNFVTAEIVIDSLYPVNGENTNGFTFTFNGHIEEVQIIRPGYELDDPRYITDEYVQHIKSAGWKTFRLTGMSGVNGNTDMTWGKRLSKNAPCSVNQWQTNGGYLQDKEIWAFDKSNGANEDNVPGQNNATGRMRGSPWETQIDVCNYLNLDMWINLPVLVDDEYVRNLAALLKQRLKPTLNVNVEIGNEMWNVFTPYFMSGWYMVQQLGWEKQYGTPEQKKIFGGADCPGCGIPDQYTGSADQRGNYAAWQRWMARRLKEHAESFATVYGWRDQGGEVGTKIRMVLAGQFYGGNGHGWNIGPGIDFLRKAYGEDAPSKYLYAVAIAPYFSTRANPDKETKESFLNMSVDDIEKRVNEAVDNYFTEFSNQLWTTNPRPVYSGNFLEGMFAKAKMSGLKMYAYEGGNEINTGGVDWGDGAGQQWIDLENGSAYLMSSKAAATTKRFFDKWYSWFGYDALFIKNGDYQSDPMGGYTMSRTLNENLPMRNEYIRIANSPAPPLSRERGNVVDGSPVAYLDARKVASYTSDWENNIYGFPAIGYSTSANPDWTLKNENSFDRPFIIRCEKAGKYKFSMERSLVDGRLQSDSAWPTYIDIYLNEKLIVAGQNMPIEGITRSIRYDVDGGNRIFGFTKDIELDLPYGVHILRIKPSLPTAARSGNNGYYGENSKYINRFDLMQYRFKNQEIVTNVEEYTPLTAKLLSVYPNPFTTEVQVKINLPESAYSQVSVLNATGEIVSTLVNKPLNSGEYIYTFAAPFPGLYFLQFKHGNSVVTHKLIAQ